MQCLRLRSLLYSFVVSAPANAGSPKLTTQRPPFMRGLRNPAAWLLGLAFGCFTFCFLATSTWAPSYLTETLGIDLARASFYVSLFSLAGIGGNVVAGWAINRVRRRHSLMIGATIVCTVGFGFVFSLGREALVAPFMLSLGFIGNFIPTSCFTLAPETAEQPELAGMAMALLLVGSNLGVLVGPPVSGALLEATSWTTGGILLAIVMAFGTILSILAWKRMSRS